MTGIRFDWGVAGARAAAAGGALVIVDVLSFSTAVSVATGRGTAVYPHPWPAPGIEAFAAAHDAAYAVHRQKVTVQHPWSLSPAHLLAAPAPERLVLPSPNGSTIAAASTGLVLAGCLRNASATARWLEGHGFGTAERPVTVIAAGEHWPEGELRPALEDLLGAAAVIAAFDAHAVRSPEAAATDAVWHTHRHHLNRFLADCYSGRELAALGFAADVTIAAEHDAQDTAAVLTSSAFHSQSP